LPSSDGGIAVLHMLEKPTLPGRQDSGGAAPVADVDRITIGEFPGRCRAGRRIAFRILYESIEANSSIYYHKNPLALARWRATRGRLHKIEKCFSG
jgi:hypothetical protein